MKTTSVTAAKHLYTGDTIVHPTLGELLITGFSQIDGNTVCVEADAIGGRSERLLYNLSSRVTILGA